MLKNKKNFKVTFFKSNKSDTFKNPYDDAQFTVLYDCDEYLDFCKKMNHSPCSDYVKRFSQHYHAVAVCGDTIRGTCWFSSSSGLFFIEEIRKSIFIPDDINIIFDIYVEPEYRKSGYFTALLGYTASVIPGKTSLVYADSKNLECHNEIKRAGFELTISALAHNDNCSAAELVVPDRNSTPKKSILFMSESLGCGGAENVLGQLLQYIDKKKYNIYTVSETDNEVHTDTVRVNSRYSCFAPKITDNSKIKTFIRKCKIWFFANAPLGLVYRIFIHGKYDIEVAFCEGYGTKLISHSSNKNSKKIAWVHVNHLTNPWSETLYKSIDEERYAYGQFDVINCVSQSVRDAFIEKFGFHERAAVVYNPVDENRIVTMSREKFSLGEFDGTTFLSVGRLEDVKGYQRLIRIAKNLHDDDFKFRIIIVGDGTKRTELESLISKLDAEEYFILAGFQSNPYKYMANSDVFICSSFDEGFSTVATESLILNLPIVTTDCSGMAELFGGLDCGIICENDENALYEAMKKVLENLSLLDTFKRNELIRSDEFKILKRISVIENLFDRL